MGSIMILFSVLLTEYLGLMNLPLALGVHCFVNGFTALPRPYLISECFQFSPICFLLSALHLILFSSQCLSKQGMHTCMMTVFLNFRISSARRLFILAIVPVHVYHFGSDCNHLGSSLLSDRFPVTCRSKQKRPASGGCIRQSQTNRETPRRQTRFTSANTDHRSSYSLISNGIPFAMTVSSVYNSYGASITTVNSTRPFDSLQTETGRSMTTIEYICHYAFIAFTLASF